MLRNTIPGAAVCLTIALLISALPGTAEVSESDFRMTVLDAFAITGRGVVVTGRVVEGAAEAGDWVCVPMLEGEAVGRQIAGLEMFRKVLERVEAGDNAGLLFETLDHKQIARNAELVAGCSGDL